MGTCASTQHISTKGGNFTWQSSAVNIVHLDGKLQQLKNPVKAWHVLSQNPNCFLCCSESINVGSPMPALNPHEELQLDHIYFLVPVGESRAPLSLQGLGALAIKAHAHSDVTKLNLKPSSQHVSKRSVQTHPMGCSH